MKSLLGKAKTLVYGILFSLGYASCSSNVASADENPARRKQIASFTRKSETDAHPYHPSPEAIRAFFEGNAATAFYENFQYTRIECGGFLTAYERGKTLLETLYAFDDPSDEPLNNSIDNLVEGKLTNDAMLASFIRTRDFTEMAQNPYGYHLSKTLIDCLKQLRLDPEPITFQDRWAWLISKRISTNTLPDANKREEQRLKWKSQLAPELKYAIVNTVYDCDLGKEEDEASSRNEKIAMEWHLHPDEIGPSMIDLLVSLKEKDRHHMVLSTRNERLHYWLYKNGAVIENGLLYNAKTKISKAEIFPLESKDETFPEIRNIVRDIFRTPLTEWLYWRDDKEQMETRKKSFNDKKPSEGRKKPISKRMIRVGRKWI